MSDPPKKNVPDSRSMISALSAKERELSRMARSLLESNSGDESEALAWFELVEQAAVSLRSTARDLEEMGAAGLLNEPQAPLPSMEARALTSAKGILSGHATVIPVSEILSFLSDVGKSGVLWVEADKEGFLVQLDRGSVVYAQGDSPPRGQRLGEILVRHRVLTAEQVENAINEASKSKEVLGTYMMEHELITKQELSAALAEQAQLIFDRMFDAEDSSYQFEDGQRMVESEDMHLNVIQLLLESARANDEANSFFGEQFGISIGRPEGMPDSGGDPARASA